MCVCVSVSVTMCMIACHTLNGLINPFSCFMIISELFVLALQREALRV